MDAGLLAQHVVVGLAVLASVVFVVRRQFPGSVRRARVACALRLRRRPTGSLAHRLGTRLAPAATATSADGCGGCDGCD
ncbi:hypothetical protein GCM10028862_02020 [Luteimonas pelagia]